MKKLLIPIVLLLMGTGAGVGAGILLKPDRIEEEAHVADCLPMETTTDVAQSVPLTETVEDVEYAKLTNQFVVPVIANEQIAAMVVMTLSVEVPVGSVDAVFAVEPKLRDGFLQVMFNHANVGGFSGNFTAISNMGILREDLLRSAQEILGPTARDILVLDIVRQDV